ncbi:MULTISPECIES: alpha/beta fold hydrolase [Rhizobium]|uniref:alpha/beta fold hydrolase n=1 Tax=Rhizobium TaxID=379 RepID=UPI001441E44E|nr:alpha/beta fold hydrolase [Rhizobium leguminosarum bv. viciae]
MTNATANLPLPVFRLGGSGPNLLLLHGFGADRMSWIANQDALMQSFAVFSCDLPAHGGQPPGRTGMKISEMADELIDALARQNDRFVVVGHSLGGAIAIELAARRPDLVAGLGLIAPAGLGKEVGREFLSELPELSELGSALALLQRLVSRPRLITPPIAQRLLDHLERPGIRAALRALASELSHVETSIEPHVASIAVSRVPRIVIWGEEDTINPIDRPRLSRFNAQVLALPDTGHLPHVEASRAVSQHLCEFLKSAVLELGG